jgi:hypothetical protein
MKLALALAAATLRSSCSGRRHRRLHEPAQGLQRRKRRRLMENFDRYKRGEKFVKTEE